MTGKASDPGKRAQGGRFPLLVPDRLSSEQRVLYEAVAGPPRAGGPFLVVDDDGCLAGPFNVLLYSPGIGQAVEALGSALRFGGTLSDRTRELVICAVAAALDSDYEWYAHSRVARSAGISPDELETLQAGRMLQGLPADEQAALALASALLHGRGVESDIHAEALKHFGHAGITELSVLVGYYQMLAGLLAAGDVPAPGSPEPAPEYTGQ
ncbi:carboxymuconolactone decarboxylase family protein [Arthrobacter sp. H14]|uniref:carboxymuconolactone decarboxylase family protein n=1 Tax=Arthrobacter sp. H14 TaxID=1312959 RepID=UPI0004BCC05A|nr:carboxymuconolactone decarboxylase family protein [Arthrobacter sp. H14]